MPLTKLAASTAITLAIALAGCTTQLTEKGQRVNLITASSVHACDLVELFTLKGSSADDAMNLAFNKAGELGANSVGVKSVSGSGEITALAFNCHR
ncbi:DUF4156 domain-containing protein [Pseudomonas guariconensis]|uniref:DUF4156 domain-containing protein n=1 Tax=Pseudomonas guariconensis TaxID=1288410 RepID=UPI00209B47A1|nr:DUF4156 domain-containing protein [Pseudomonas guariconensis]MCO7634102.1 DUF4156 domain-containing protein [Pseudomonas guariconensis]